MTTYSYDGLGRLTGKSYSNGDPAVSYTYDAAGRLETAANGTDKLTWSYDLAGQLLSEQSATNASTVSYTQDLAGNRLSLSLEGQLFVSYGYDDASRLTSITRGSSVFGFGYDEVNRRTSMTYPNAITTTYGYDDLNRLTSLSAVHNGTTTITSFGYTYDAAGNRLTKATPEFTEGYGYDELSRLTAVDRTGTLTGLWRFGYDAVGNRTTAQTNDSVLTSTFNEKNQLTSSSGGGTLRVRGTLNEAGTAKVNGTAARMLAGNIFEATIQATTGTNTFPVEATDVSGNVTTKNYQVNVSGSGAGFSYDANGNLISKTEGSDTWTYEWNAEGQLKRVVLNGNEVARFAYDPLGRRVEKVAGGVTTGYSYDGENILREVRGATTLKYFHGPAADQPLAREDGAGSPTYYHADGLGSIVSLTSQAGAVVHEYRYDAWGNIEAGASEPGYSFTGREWDPETGLYYYRARYYDPGASRFISEDPAGGSGTLYVYANNNPLRFVDPFGLKERDQVVIEAFRALKDAKAEVEQVEFGGLVCWDPICRSFYTTGPVRGPKPVGTQRMHVDVFKAPCRSGDTYAGYYHTHPPWDTGFSGEDVRIADDPRRRQPAYVWLTAPGDGRVVRYDPTTGAPGQGKQTIVTTIPWP